MNKRRKQKLSAIPSKENYLIVKVDESGVVKGLSKNGKRIYVTINAFVFSINEAKRRYLHVRKLLLEYDGEENRKKPMTGGSCTISLDCPYRNEIVSSAWDIIDWIERARKILGSIAGIPKKDSRYISIMSALKPVTEYRHMLQHFDNDVIATLVGKTFPVMGAVLAKYADGNKSYGRVIISTPARYAGDQTISIAGANAIGAHAQPPIDNITFSLANAIVNLSGMFEKIDSSTNGIREFLSQTYDYDWASVDNDFV